MGTLRLSEAEAVRLGIIPPPEPAPPPASYHPPARRSRPAPQPQGASLPFLLTIVAIMSWLLGFAMGLGAVR